MAFPFSSASRDLRERMLAAIQVGGLLGLAVAGCSSGAPAAQSPGVGMNMPPMTAPPSATVGKPAGMGGSAGGGGPARAGSGASGGSGGGGIGVGGGAGSAASGAGVGGIAGSTAPACNGARPERLCHSREAMEAQFRFGCGMIPKEPVPTSAQIAAAFLPNGCLPRNESCNSCCNPGASDGEPQADGSCCYWYCSGSCCGRPFTASGGQRVADAVLRSDWLTAQVPADTTQRLPDALAARIASEWLADARMEHASIASFARFTLDLLACGAPSQLVEEAQRAALDEVAHARICFTLAARYGTTSYGPGALATADASGAADLAGAVRLAFLEGCVGETLAANQARAACEISGDAQVAAALARIAEDEARHAQLAWRFVAWAGAQGAVDLRRELGPVLESLAADRHACGPELDCDADVAWLHRAGRLTSTEKQLCNAATLREVVLPCAMSLLAARSGGSTEG